MSRSWHAAVICAATLSAQSAAAQGNVSGQLDRDRVEVGQAFQYQLTAMSAGGPLPEDPRLQVPPGISATGPSVGRNEQMSFVNGRIERKSGITATWTLSAREPGTFSIGPATVRVDGVRQQTPAATVQVLAPGSLPQAPRARRRRGRWPFGGRDPFEDLDPFNLLPGFGDVPEDLEQQLAPQVPEELAVDRAPDAMAFLRATIHPAEAVVGEQQTLRIYAYGGRGPFQEINTSEPSRPDFLSHVLIENSYRQPQYRLPIGEQLFHAVKVREVALFPIKAGKLTVGPMRMGFRGQYYPAQSVHEGLVRHSAPIEVIIREPPLQGRPAGYQLGDVGRFSLEATLEPRQVQAGGSVSVLVKLAGTGNLPHKLHPPQRSGVEWLEPTMTEAIEPKGSVIGGWRQFSYVVQFDQPGSVELGEIRLPYFDPATGRYQTARADLGSVRVIADPQARREPNTTPDTPRLRDLVTVRETLGGDAHKPWGLTDRAGFWWLLLLGPASILGAQGMRLSWRRVRSRHEQRRHSLAARARQALSEARAAVSGRNAATAIGSAERAVYAGLEDGTGVKARALLRHELSAELGRRGLSPQLAADLVAFLDRCDTARFAVQQSNVDELVAEATRLLDAVSREKRRSAEPPQ